jgi:glutamine cyclotransferase
VSAKLALSVAVILAIATWLSDPVSTSPTTQAAATEGYRVLNVYPHDPEAFTQGLIFRDGFLFESTGQYGRSTLRKVELKTGRVVQQHRLDPVYFGEGLAEWNEQLVQLTWRSQIAFVYDLVSLSPRRMFGYSGEGWGLTHNQREFILSDGTDTLRFFNPNTFRETRRLIVRDGNTPVENLNELEYVRGEIYANIWHSDKIARISPQSGQVVGWIDLNGLMSAAYKLEPEAVLNGIAYDAANNRLFVTGKLWPRLFEIQVVPRR